MSAICTNTFRRSSFQYDNSESMIDSPNVYMDDDNRNRNVNDYDIENTIRLQLKKPKHWDWELTTSKSSPNIAFPRILLYDSNGDLLADAHESDLVFTSATMNRKDLQSDKGLIQNSTISDPGKLSRSSTITATTATNKRKRRLSSADLRQVQSSLSDFIDQLSERGIECKLNGKLSRKSSDSIVRSNSNLSLKYNENCTTAIRSEGTTDNFSDISLASIESKSAPISNEKKDQSKENLNSNKLKDRYQRQNSSLNDISKTRIDDKSSGSTPVKEVRFNLHKSQSAFEMNNLWSEREKRKCRRSKSTEPSKFSSSILERMRAFNERSSSSEELDMKVTDVNHGPRYFLRTCRAGTLVVCEESFRQRKVRRRPISIARISEAEETDSKPAVPERIIRRTPVSYDDTEHQKITNKREYPSVQKNGIDKAISELSLNEKMNLNNEKYLTHDYRSKSLAFCENSGRNRNDDDEIKAQQKRKKSKKLRRCVSAGTVVCFPTSSALSSSSSDDDCSQASYKNVNFRSKRKSSTSVKRRIHKEKGDQILTINNNNSGRTTRKTTNRIPSEVQQTIGIPSFENTKQIDEKSGSDEDLVTNFVHRLSTTPTLKKHNDNHNISDVLDNLNDKKIHLVESKLSSSSLLDQHNNRDNLQDNITNDDRSGNGEGDYDEDDGDGYNEKDSNLKLLLGQCQNSIENIIESSFSNIKNKKFEVNNLNGDTSTDTTTTIITTRNACNDNVLNLERAEEEEELEEEGVEEELEEEEEVELEYAKICDYNNNDNDNNNENENDDNDDDDNEYYRDFIENGCNYDDNDNSTYVLSETTNCTDSETETVLNFNHLINKNNLKISNDQNKIIEHKNFINMGSNVSRNSGNGLSGRRTQSSGNLYTGKHTNSNTTTACSYSSNLNPNDKFNSTLPSDIIVGVQNGSACKQQNKQLLSSVSGCNMSKNHQTESITKKDRNKFCGSLPNHLDDTENESNKGIEQQLDRIDVITSLEEEEEVEEKSEKKQKYRQHFVPVASLRRQNQNKHQHQQHQQHQQQQQQQLNSSSNTISSGMESSATQPSTDSFRSSCQVKADIQLKLPLVRSNADPSCDQGYGSERSPEDELPPLMPDLSSIPFQYLQNYNMDWDYRKCIQNPYCYSFITKDCIFSLQITKGSRGLGLSISGGIDSNSAFPGLIRIKRLFPHQPAWSTGKLQPGDIILEANEVPLTGLTNYEALEVLRTMPNEVLLLICRPSDEEYKKLSPPADPPKPPSRQTQQQATQTSPEDYPLQPLSPLQINFTGEFEILMVKQQGSLGFTLRKEDESVLGHYVRALVREPATTDGRIKPGDKIVAVNDVPLSPMTHEQAVIFLRQAADTVKLRLYRDGAQTPVAAMSPNTEYKTFCNTSKKTLLRPEAINLLSDLAHKKQITPGGDSTESSLISNSTSPRRLRRASKQTSESVSQSEQDTSDSKSSSNHQYAVSSQSASLYSDSEQSATASQCSYRALPINLEDGVDFVRSEYSDGEKPDRPNFLDLGENNGNTMTVSRKPRFQFTVATNVNDLASFENESINDNYSDECLESFDDVSVAKPNSQTDEQQSSNNNNSSSSNSGCHTFTSLPCETFLIACKTESDLKDEANFSYKNPMYQSAHVQISQNDEVPLEATKKDGNSSLLKWKGVVLSPDSEEEKKLTTNNDNDETKTVQEDDIKTQPNSTTPILASGSSDPTVTEDKQKIVSKNTFPLTTINAEGHKIISVELNRGWNSRLGFSLQSSSSSSSDSNTIKKITIISAIYSDSVAAKDGRLRVGDQLLTVNDESVEDMQTSEIIDLLRILRGSIVITVLRKNSSSSLLSS